MLKIIICSVILVSLIILYKDAIYWIADRSYWSAIAVCAIVFTFSILKALAIDRSRVGRR
jgi:hypothetical protein